MSLGVTCHLHFWQNDQGILRATVVTWGWNGHWIGVSTQSWLWRRKISCRSCWSSNSHPLDHESRALPTSYPRYPSTVWCKSYAVLASHAQLKIRRKKKEYDNTSISDLFLNSLDTMGKPSVSKKKKKKNPLSLLYIDCSMCVSHFINRYTTLYNQPFTSSQQSCYTCLTEFECCYSSVCCQLCLLAPSSGQSVN